MITPRMRARRRLLDAYMRVEHEEYLASRDPLRASEREMPSRPPVLVEGGALPPASDGRMNDRNEGERPAKAAAGLVHRQACV